MNETQLTDAELARLEELAAHYASGNALPFAEDTYRESACNATPALVAEVRALRRHNQILRNGNKAVRDGLEAKNDSLETEIRRLRADYACEHQSLVFHEQMVARLMDRVETLEWLREVEALYGDTGWIFNQKQCAIDELHVTVLAAREALEES